MFAVSRLHPLKRMGLLVEAAALMKDRALRIKIAGEGEEAVLLAERIEELGLRGRVELLGPISDAELVDHYARCRAVYFAPWNEDYGFVTLEAFRSGQGRDHDPGQRRARPSWSSTRRTGFWRRRLPRASPRPSTGSPPTAASPSGSGTAARVSAARFPWPATVEALVR